MFCQKFSLKEKIYYVQTIEVENNVQAKVVLTLTNENDFSNLNDNFFVF